MKVPFLDLKVQYLEIKKEVNESVQDIMNTSIFAGGSYVDNFEKRFAEYCQCKYAIGVGSGTDALWAALLALGVGKDDEVITTSNTFIATVEAISFCGAKPVFVDVTEDTYSMDPELLEKAITTKTKVIIPVHIFGQMCDMDKIMEIAKKHDIYVLEDACQAHGAEYNGKRAGSIGNVSAFSFYPGKNLGAYGEAGAVVTNDSELASYIKKFRDHGQRSKYYHDIIGWNVRMDNIQAAVLNIKLNYIEKWNDLRRKNALIYNKKLADIDEISTPSEADYSKHVYHIYAIRAKNRDKLIEHLKNNDIGCGIHYPIPIHLQDAYKSLNIKEGTYPVSEDSANEFISLPMFPELKEKDIDYVVDAIKEFYKI